MVTRIVLLGVLSLILTNIGCKTPAPPRTTRPVAVSPPAAVPKATEPPTTKEKEPIIPSRPVIQPLGIVLKEGQHFTVNWEGFGLVDSDTVMGRLAAGTFESKPITAWRLDLAKESGPAPQAGQVGLWLKLTAQRTHARLIAQFLAESRFEVTLPDGSKQSLSGEIDLDKANPEIWWSGTGVSFGIQPSQLFHLGSGKHSFSWIHEGRAENLAVDIR
jgi:hypothetical protein